MTNMQRPPRKSRQASPASASFTRNARGTSRLLIVPRSLAWDAERLGTLRLLKSAIGYAQIEKKCDALPDPDTIAIVQREIKKRRDSIEQFTNGGRPELAEKESREITVLEAFLPKALAPE